tara:strand:- start:466 stop:1509 length:1044 start_codon:yes stop_codon:yes gene_type:complete
MNPRWSREPPTECYSFVNKIFYNHLKFSKSKIDQYKTSEEKKKWGKFTKLMNLYENILYIEPNEKISRAFYKLIEINYNFKLFTGNETLTGHLCEAPGGFIEATCELVKNPKHIWIGQSKNTSSCIFSKKLPDNGNILWGPDRSGDIYKNETIDEFAKESRKQCQVITADGGFDVSKNYYIQEQMSFRLIFCQFVTAIKSLKVGGHFVCKIFDMFTLPTIQLLVLVKSLFKEINIFKPLASRPCNSERYLVCKIFIGAHKSTIETFQTIIKKWPTNLFMIDLGIKVNKNLEKTVKNLNNSLVGKQIEHLEETHKYASRIYSKEWFVSQKNKQQQASIEYIKQFRNHK